MPFETRHTDPEDAAFHARVTMGRPCVDDHGNGCVAPTVVTSPWYGPSITQLYAGAWSFHAMDALLDVWIDDLVFDTKPVSCPP
jgi:hypothetical protein